MASEVTILLQEISQSNKNSNREALDKLLPIVYNELRRLAGSFLNREHAVSLQTTELVHEAYFKLTDQKKVDWENRGQFFAIAAQAMRRILVDHARERHAAKRDGIKISLEDADTVSIEVNESLLDLDIALQELAAFDELQTKIVELRYFAGLTFEEIATVLEIPTTRVFREWIMARAWLFRKINGESSSKK